MLQTDTRVGLTENEVLARRKKYGLNQMKEEKESKFYPLHFPAMALVILSIYWSLDIRCQGVLHTGNAHRR